MIFFRLLIRFSYFLVLLMGIYAVSGLFSNNFLAACESDWTDTCSSINCGERYFRDRNACASSYYEDDSSCTDGCDTTSDSSSVSCSCTKSSLDGYQTGGVSCSINTACNFCTASCADGWVDADTSCGAGYTKDLTTISAARCYILDGDCDNTATCYKCVIEEAPPIDNCKDLDQCSGGTSCNTCTFSGASYAYYCECSGSGASKTCDIVSDNTCCNDNDACTTDSYDSSSGFDVCTHENVPINSSWSEWDSCSLSAGASCGPGTQTRTCDDAQSCGGSNNCTVDAEGNLGSKSCTVGCDVPGQTCYDNSCCTPVNGVWSGWGSCSNCSKSRTCNAPAPACGGTSCVGSSTQSCGDSDGSDGTCGSADGQVFASTPSSNLCSSGSSSIVSLTGRTYNWTCYGSSGSCGGSDGGDDSCSATNNVEPSFSSLALKNSGDVVVAAEAGDRNQVCQTQFSGDRIVKFVVTGTDSNGSSDITKINLRLGQTVYQGTPVNGVATFAVQFPADAATTTYNIEVLIDDNYGTVNTTWVDTGRDLKIWNCQVPVVGTVYDGSDVDQILCSNNSGFSNPIPGAMSYSLNYILGELSPRSMTVTSPTYQSNGNNLYWWSSYIADISNLTGTVADQMRVIDLGTGTTSCVSSLDLNPGLASAYSDSPSLRVDFSGILDQEPWFQASGGGINSKTSIVDNVPSTCVMDQNCSEAMSISNSSIGVNNNGLVAAPSINNNSGCGDACKQGIPNNWKKTSNVISDNSTYAYYYKEYHQKLGQGTTFVGDVSLEQVMTGTGGTGVAFVSGNLNVDSNNTVASGKLLMVIVNNKINISSGVNSIEGVFVANNIEASGTSDNQLIIDGMVYAINGIKFTRGYTNKTNNNTSPAIVVNYKPDFVFLIPGRLIKVLSGWKVGI